ncbi:hypothetical protein LAZ67_15000502 [Cordylochernes scorpioides]|uniref:Uncharacterized protein n=1 Tax=Cordylochernes scorpioides TaxID=51811 RepID=A0ABY6L834_9ARAC|nr:hypothetical protein LAZ67_15000502 [Cordylochernes scorpioides]
MVSIREYEAKKKVGGSRRYAEAKNKARSSTKKGMICVFFFLGLRRFAVLRNARKECHSQQGPLHCPIASRENSLFNRKDPIDKVKSFSFTTTLGRMLHKSSKPPFKSSNGKFYSTRRTLRTLHQPISTFSAPCTTFDDEEDLKTWLNNFFDTRPGDIWRNGLNKLVERWEEVVNNNGEYIIDQLISGASIYLSISFNPLRRPTVPELITAAPITSGRCRAGHVSRPGQKLLRFHRRFKAKTYLQDDDVPIDDTKTKPYFTPQETDAKVLGTIFKTSMEYLAEARQIHVSNNNC